MATVRDIARICNVSPATVSLVLNNRAGQVGEETRQTVLKAVREVGYKPQSVRRSAQPHIVKTLGISPSWNAVSFLTPGYGNYIMDGILGAAEQAECNLTLLHRKVFFENDQMSLRAHIDGRCDGVIVVAPMMDSLLVEFLYERGIPFVLIGAQGKHSDILSVDVDNVHEGKRATEVLIQLGHRRIAFIGGPNFVQSANQRHEGYRSALEAANLPYDPFLDTCADHPRDEPVAYEITRRLMQLPAHQRPTAFFCWNDTVAVRTLMALEDTNLKRIGQPSVIGFDDNPKAVFTNPPLTTFQQPYAELGEKAVQLLKARIQNDLEADAIRAYFLPAELIVRESVLPM